MREPSADQFLKEVAQHEMTVELDQGVYRHVRFRSPERGWNLWFDLVTWPGFLCISGDMGTWTFARVPDMFTFFRSSGLRINASYWAEKLQNGTHGGRSNAKEWDEGAFIRRLNEQLENYYSLEGGDLETVKAALKEEVLDIESGNGQHALMRAAAEFTCETSDGKFQFDPCELPDGMVYSYHFLWCLHAIVWGIQQYDAKKQAEAA